MILRCVLFDVSSGLVTYGHLIPESVRLDRDGLSWWYHKGQPDEQLLNIGSGSRPPEPGDTGIVPVFVYDVDEPGHIARKRAIVDELKETGGRLVVN